MGAGHYRYDPYGKVTITRGGAPQTTDPLGQHWAFTGRFSDEEATLCYYRARYYDPMVGRFVQRDPIGFAVGPNLYTYVDSNVANCSDPSGLRSDAFGPSSSLADVDVAPPRSGRERFRFGPIGGGRRVRPGPWKPPTVDTDPIIPGFLTRVEVEYKEGQWVATKIKPSLGVDAHDDHGVADKAGLAIQRTAFIHRVYLPLDETGRNIASRDPLIPGWWPPDAPPLSR